MKILLTLVTLFILSNFANAQQIVISTPNACTTVKGTFDGTGTLSGTCNKCTKVWVTNGTTVTNGTVSNNKNGVTFGFSFAGLANGTYTLSVKDSYGDIDEQSITVNNCCESSSLILPDPE